VVVKPGVDAAGARDYRDSHDRQECRQALGLAPEQRVLVCLGQLWPLKGQALLVRALRQAVAARGPLACVLIGDPTEPCAGSLRRFVTEQGLGETVRLVPFLDDPRPWLVSADVAVCPSESESMPASVLEAMAFGLPVLASRVGDVPELVVPGRSGWLFEPCHLGSLSSALEQVAAAPAETLREMGAEGARRMAAEHDRAASLRRMRELLVGATA
jgi:glycosyltransferase involved in cell wall biosynthesis